MKNKIELKKYIIKILLVTLCSSFLFILINIYEYHIYTVNFNNKISQIVSKLQEKYPSVSNTEIMEILNRDTNTKTEIFDKYGIDINDNSILIQNDKENIKFLVFNILYIIIVIVLISIIFLKYDKKKEKDIKDIINYIEQINKKNYELQIDSISEDELSILKNEIYKTTIMLKENAENSKIDKINLKQSLEDISHQLKTPLTSILIMLDNIIDDPDMDKDIRNDFIKDIKRGIDNINFLVITLLKLSKFDSNTINFINENVNVKVLIGEAIKNVILLCDLKNVKIDIKNDDDVFIDIDLKWQVEALTNILKNSIEHSKENSTIFIEYENNNAYLKIIITDEGEGISKKDLLHIFERFYKGENSRENNFGIGLSLSKSIIEKNNGKIYATSDENGTAFIIKYYKI